MDIKRKILKRHWTCQCNNLHQTNFCFSFNFIHKHFWDLYFIDCIWSWKSYTLVVFVLWSKAHWVSQNSESHMIFAAFTAHIYGWIWMIFAKRINYCVQCRCILCMYSTGCTLQIYRKPNGSLCSFLMFKKLFRALMERMHT